MELAVARICEVSFSHSYYTDGVIKNLSIEPTSACRKFLSNYRIFFRDKSDGFALLSTLEETDSTKPFISVNKNICLSFAVTINNPYFLNFSDLPSDLESSEIFYFSNLNDNVNGTDLLINSDTSSEYVNENDIIQYAMFAIMQLNKFCHNKCKIQSTHF